MNEPATARERSAAIARRVPLALAAVVLAGTNGCGGGSPGDRSLPAPAPTPPLSGATSTYTGATARATITFGANATGAGRAPAYVPPNATALAVTASVNGQTLTSSVPLTPGAKAVQVDVPTGTVKLTIAMVDAKSNVLATNTTTVTIVPNSANAISITLLGVIASLQVTPDSQSVDLGTGTSFAVTVVALDAAGSPITGTAPYANPMTLNLTGISAASFKLSATQLTAPGTSVTLTYDGSGSSGTSATVNAATAATTTTPAVTGSADIAVTQPVVTDVLTVTPTSLALSLNTASATLPIQISEMNAKPGSITLLATCPTGATITLSAATVPTNATTSVSVTALVAPLATVSPACTILISSSSGQSATVSVDVRDVQLQIQRHQRAQR